MKPFNLQWIVALAILISCAEVTAATAPRGLVLYTEPPNTYVNSLEFVSLTDSNPVYAVAVVSHGPKQEIPKAGILAIIKYPPDVPTESFPTDAVAALRSVQALRTKYPQLLSKLDGIQAKWTSVLAVYRTRQRVSQGVTPKPTALPQATALPTLDLYGLVYSNVVLKSFNGEYVEIFHSAGKVARIDTIYLKLEQIDALNSTSASVRITPSDLNARWIAEAVRKYPALSEKDSPLNQAFLAIYDDTRRKDPRMFKQPDWPMQLAMRAGSNLRAATSGAKAVDVQTASTAAIHSNDAEQANSHCGDATNPKSDYTPTPSSQDILAIHNAASDISLESKTIHSNDAQSGTPHRDDAANQENSYAPTLSSQDLLEIHDLARDCLLHDKMVHVNSYVRESGVRVSAYERQPPGGLKFSDGAEAEAWSWVIALGAEITVDYAIPRFRKWWSDREERKQQDEERNQEELRKKAAEP